MDNSNKDNPPRRPYYPFQAFCQGLHNGIYIYPKALENPANNAHNCDINLFLFIPVS